jgi:hypothetical protein
MPSLDQLEAKRKEIERQIRDKKREEAKRRDAADAKLYVGFAKKVVAKYGGDSADATERIEHALVELGLAQAPQGRRGVEPATLAQPSPLLSQQHEQPVHQTQQWGTEQH